MVLKGDKILKRNSFCDKNFCSPQLWGQYKMKAVFPSEWLGEGVLLPFEDIRIVVPSKFREYLTQLYGNNYMELPPIEKRIAHHSSQIIFKGTDNENE